MIEESVGTRGELTGHLVKVEVFGVVILDPFYTVL